jgi:hypothetical protein
MGVSLAEIWLGRGSRFDHITGGDAFKDHTHMKVLMKVLMPPRERGGIVIWAEVELRFDVWN